MEKVLFLSATEENGSLARVGAETLNAAKKIAGDLGAELVAGIVGGEVEAATKLASGCSPAKILVVSGSEFSSSRYATDAAAIEAICRASEATVILCPATSRMNRVVAGVAQRLGGVAETHVTALLASGEGLKVRRWYYKQRMEAELTRTKRPWFLTVDAGNFDSWTETGSGGSVEKIAVELKDALTRTKVEGFKAPPADEQTIWPDAELLFVAGAGWSKKQADGIINLKSATNIIGDFLKKSGASLGGSKSVVDMGTGEGEAALPFMTHLNQVGQTGSTPRHPKGLATCCHGEEPHVIGWRFINERRAINMDANCGWAQGKADVLYVADAFEVMSKLNELL